MRQNEIEASVDHFLEIHDKWTKSNDELLTDSYETALLKMTAECLKGDIPANHCKLVGAVAQLLKEYERIEEYAAETGGHVESSFWKAVETVSREREGTVIHPPRPIESVRELRRQGVSDNQIAQAIYGHNGKGPFLDRGIVRTDLIQKEIDVPGSVIPEGWTHPAMEELYEKERAEAAGRITEIASRITAPVPAPETTEELLRQRVPVNQIALIKGCSPEDVIAEAEELDLPYEFSPTYKGERNFKLSESDQQIADLLRGGLTAKEVAAELGCTAQKAAAVGRKINK